MRALVLLPALAMVLASCVRHAHRSKTEDDTEWFEQKFRQRFDCPGNRVWVLKDENLKRARHVHLHGCGERLDFRCRGHKCQSPQLVLEKRFGKAVGCEREEISVKKARDAEETWTVKGCDRKYTYRCKTDRRGLECETDSEQDERIGFGTCFAVNSQGTVVTAAHVIGEQSDAVSVAIIGHEFVPAKVEKLSKEDDLAVLKVPTPTPRFLKLAVPGAATVGQRVFTMGFPVSQWLGVEPKFTDGSISALGVGSGQTGLLQMTAPIQPGNSGGPLLTEAGDVVGVVTSTAAVEQFFRNTGALPQGINFAVKSERLQKLLPNLETRDAEQEMTREEAIEHTRRSLCAVRVGAELEKK